MRTKRVPQLVTSGAFVLPISLPITNTLLLALERTKR
jgi:hypothetical protein